MLGLLKLFVVPALSPTAPTEPLNSLLLKVSLGRTQHPAWRPRPRCFASPTWTSFTASIVCNTKSLDHASCEKHKAWISRLSGKAHPGITLEDGISMQQVYLNPPKEPLYINDRTTEFQVRVQFVFLTKRNFRSGPGGPPTNFFPCKSRFLGRTLIDREKP
jgi:hypothetical protein